LPSQRQSSESGFVFTCASHFALPLFALPPFIRRREAARIRLCRRSPSLLIENKRPMRRHRFKYPSAGLAAPYPNRQQRHTGPGSQIPPVSGPETWVTERT
jgi:hypothetical protein